MKKIDLGQAITILANVGVLVGILLLVFELNQNRQMMQSQTRTAVAEILVGLLALEASDAELIELQAKAASGQTTPTEQTRFVTLYEAYWRYRENVYYQFRNGLYDQDEYIALRNAWVEGLNSSDAIRSTYCSRRHVQPPAFTEEMDAQLDRPCE
jgi:hypothetical protein